MTDRAFIKNAIFLLRAAVTILIIWLLLRYALRWLLPFIAALGIARLLEPVVSMLCARLKLPRPLASALCTVFVFAAAIALVSLIVARASYELTAFARRLAELSGGLSEAVASLFSKMRGFIESAPKELQAPIRSALEGLPGKAGEVAASLSKWIISLLSGILSAGPKILLFAFTCALGTFFISSAYSQFTGFIMRQIPERHHAAMRDIRSDLRRTTGNWFKAQLILTGVTFCELFVLFCIMRIDFAILLALAVAVVDMLPVLGTGIALIPWALFLLVSGKAPQAILLFAGYAVILIVRNILEPKLVAGQLGLPPVAALIAMYVGFQTLGVRGMAVFPMVLIMLKHLHDRGYIRLWK